MGGLGFLCEFSSLLENCLPYLQNLKSLLIAKIEVGVWLSLVEYSVRDAGVVGSNPITPTSLLDSIKK